MYTHIKYGSSFISKLFRTIIDHNDVYTHSLTIDRPYIPTLGPPSLLEIFLFFFIPFHFYFTFI